MPQRNVATNFTFEQQRAEINLLAQDFWSQKGTVDAASTTYLKHDGTNNFTGGTLAVPAAFTINSNSGAGTVTIAGNLQVDGTTTTVNTATMDVVDKNITIAKGSANDAAADGAGITIDSATDITWNFVDANDAWVSSIGVEATTFLKGPYGQFTGSGTPTTGQGVEVNAPDANTGQIISYDRGNTAYKDLRLKGASVAMYAGTTNALIGGFHNTGLHLESGKTLGVGVVPSSGEGSELAVKGTDGATNVALIPNADTESSSIAFYNAAYDSQQGYIKYDNNNNSLSVRVNLQERLLVTSTGLVTNKGTWTNTYAANDTTQCGIQVQNLSDTTDTYAALRLTSGTNSPATAQITSIRKGAGQNDLAIQLESGNTAFEALRIKSTGQVLIGTDASNTSDRFTIVDPGNAFMSLRSATEADGHSQVIDFAVGTGDRASSNLVSTITAAIPTGAGAGGTLKGYLAFSSNAGDSLAERVRINEYGNLVAGINPTTSSSGSGVHNVPLCVHGPDKNAITLMLGNSANGVGSFGANDYSADIRFNGSNVAWGDISYYPNGDGGGGSFRFSRNGSTVSSTPNAAIGCGGLTCNGGMVQTDNSGETAFGSKSLPAADSGYYVRNGNGGTGTYASIGLIASSTSAASDQSASLVVKCTASGLSPEVYLTQRDGSNSQRNVLAINTLGDATFIGAITSSSGAISDNKGDLRTLPRNEPGSNSAYTAVTADKGKFLSVNSNVTFDNSATWNTGDVVTVYNYGSSALTIVSGTGVLIHYTDGTTASTGNRTLAARGLCTLLCVEGSNNTFVISGALT